MEFRNRIESLSEKIDSIKEQLTTEEATKNALIMPFIQHLGYDVFNPMEVVPEFTADIGLKQGEKVDYAILKEGKPVILIEAKHWREKLDNHDSQLHRYFHNVNARFAILTNGIEYRFFSDLENKNKIDSKPFLKFNIQNIKDSHLNEIQKFKKEHFDESSIINTANSLKQVNAIKDYLHGELEEPTEGFVRFIASQVYSGRVTQNVLEQFTEFVNTSFNQVIGEKVKARLNSALNEENEKQEEEEIVIPPKIITTDEELEGYQIVKAIVRREIDSERIYYRDTQSYFNILIDDNRNKTICRLWLNGSKKYISIMDERGETKHLINQIDDIYKFEEELLNAIKPYL